jgi:hypothetical protein
MAATAGLHSRQLGSESMCCSGGIIVLALPCGTQVEQFSGPGVMKAPLLHLVFHPLLSDSWAITGM